MKLLILFLVSLFLFSCSIEKRALNQRDRNQRRLNALFIKAPYLFSDTIIKDTVYLDTTVYIPADTISITFPCDSIKPGKTLKQVGVNGRAGLSIFKTWDGKINATANCKTDTVKIYIEKITDRKYPPRVNIIQRTKFESLLESADKIGLWFLVFVLLICVIWFVRKILI